MSEQTIEKQLEFVEWLKEKGIYNRFASATNMQAMYEVWDKMILPKPKTVEQWEERRDEVYPDDGPLWKWNDNKVMVGWQLCEKWIQYPHYKKLIVANHHGKPEDIK